MSEENNTDAGQQTGTSPLARAAGVNGAGAPRVLVVDDVPVNVKLLEAMLAPLKYEVLKAFDGLEALAVIERGDIDLVLLDVMMPGIDGIEVCRRIKSQEQTRIIPVVMVTSLDEIEARMQAIEAGADDFVAKPVNKLELLTRTRSLIGVKRLHENVTVLENALISGANTVAARDVYKRALAVIRSHHEKMDASGHPDGWQEETLSMVVRITAVADHYDALITGRPSRSAFTREEALRLIRQEAAAGRLDGQVVDDLIVAGNEINS